MKIPKDSKINVIKNRLQSSEDFPALSKAVMMVSQKSAKLNDFTVKDITGDILNDISITNKLLRVVNSFGYVSAHASGKINTISRAVFVAGFDRIKSIALSILLFENIHDEVVAEYLKEDVFCSFMSGVFAREMAASVGIKDTETVFICALFHKLGKLLSTFLLPIETIEIRKLINDKGMREQEAVLNVLGHSYDEIGMEIARSWNFSQEMIQTMQNIGAQKVDEPKTALETKHSLVCFSNEISELLSGEDAQLRKNLMKLLKRYENCFNLTNEQITGIMETAGKELAEYSGSYHNSLQAESFIKRFKQVSEILDTYDFCKPIEPATDTSPPEFYEEDDENILELGDVSECRTYSDEEPEYEQPSSKTPYREMPDNAVSLLKEGIEVISQAVREKFSFNELLSKILEIMYESLGFSRVLFCVKNPKEPIMEGRFGHAKDIHELLSNFKFRLEGPSNGSRDIFNIALAENSDVIIENVDDRKIEKSIPEWYRELIDAQTFILLPVVVDKKPIGLIYADKPLYGDLRLSASMLRLLSELRDQVVEAIKTTRKRLG